MGGRRLVARGNPADIIRWSNPHYRMIARIGNTENPLYTFFRQTFYDKFAARYFTHYYLLWILAYIFIFVSLSCVLTILNSIFSNRVNSQHLFDDAFYKVSIFTIWSFLSNR